MIKKGEMEEVDGSGGNGGDGREEQPFAARRPSMDVSTASMKVITASVGAREKQLTHLVLSVGHHLETNELVNLLQGRCGNV